MKRQWLKGVGASLAAHWLGAGTLLPTQVMAANETWPLRPIRLIVPAAPGGGADTVARIFAQALGDRLGQPVLVDNRPGAGGTAGVTSGLQAPADGHTFIWCTPSAQIMSPSQVRYDPMKDLSPVSLLVTAPYLLVVGPQQPWRELRELVDSARQKPGSLNYGTAGTGTFGHYMAASFGLATGTSLVQVPFTGEGPAMMALMRGDVQMAFVSGAGSVPHVAAGRVRALGLSTTETLDGLPSGLPPIAATVPGFDLVAINYLAARSGTPQPIIERMSHIVQAVLASPAVRERIRQLGVTPTGSSPEVLRRRILSERQRVQDTVQRSGLVFE